MNRIIEFVIKHKVLTAVILIGIFVLPLIFTHIFFKIPISCEWLNATWSSGDILGYCISFFTFSGTMFLGGITVWQTQQMQKENIEKGCANTQCPFFIIDKVEVEIDGRIEKLEFEKNKYVWKNVKQKTVKVHLKNVGQGIANNVSYPTGMGRIPEERKVNICIPTQDVLVISLSLADGAADKDFHKDVKYQNLLGYQYFQTLKYKKILKVQQIDEDGDSLESYDFFVYLLSSQNRIGLEKGIR